MNQLLYALLMISLLIGFVALEGCALLKARKAMKYPFHTQSKPVVGYEAARLVEAVKSGKAITNDAVTATAKRIAARRKRKQERASAAGR